MNIFLVDIPPEIKPVEESSDKGLVISSQVGKRGLEHPEVVKEMAALDAIMYGGKAIAEIHGVTDVGANQWANGKHIKDEEARDRIIATRHEIADIATSKLMETLGLLDPKAMKPRDVISTVSALGNLVEKITGKAEESGKVLHLHLHAPNQKKESQYETIEA